MKLFYKSESVEEQRKLFQKIANLGIPYFYSTNLGGKYMGCAVYDDTQHFLDYPLTHVSSYVVTDIKSEAIVSTYHIVYHGDDDVIIIRSSMDSFIQYVKEKFNISGMIFKKPLLKHELQS